MNAEEKSYMYIQIETLYHPKGSIEVITSEYQYRNGQYTENDLIVPDNYKQILADNGWEPLYDNGDSGSVWWKGEPGPKSPTQYGFEKEKQPKRTKLSAHLQKQTMMDQFGTV